MFYRGVKAESRFDPLASPMARLVFCLFPYQLISLFFFIKIVLTGFDTQWIGKPFFCISSDYQKRIKHALCMVFTESLPNFQRNERTKLRTIWSDIEHIFSLMLRHSEYSRFEPECKTRFVALSQNSQTYRLTQDVGNLRYVRAIQGGIGLVEIR